MNDKSFKFCKILILSFASFCMLIAITITVSTHLPGNNPIKEAFLQQNKEIQIKNEQRNETNYREYHPLPITLHATVITKSFTPKYTKYSPQDDMQDVSVQANAYLNSIKNIKDYNVQVSTNNSSLFSNAIKTVTLTHK